MYLKVQRYVFLGELPENLKDVKEQRGSMTCAMIVLAWLCVLMGLLLLVPGAKAMVLDPAVDVLVEGISYSGRIIAMP